MTFDVLSRATTSRARLGRWKVPLLSRKGHAPPHKTQHPLEEQQEQQQEEEDGGIPVAEWMTPCGLEYTRQGSLPHLADLLLSTTTTTGSSGIVPTGPLHIAMEQFLSMPGGRGHPSSSSSSSSSSSAAAVEGSISTHGSNGGKKKQKKPKDPLPSSIPSLEKGAPTESMESTAISQEKNTEEEEDLVDDSCPMTLLQHLGIHSYLAHQPSSHPSSPSFTTTTTTTKTTKTIPLTSSSSSVTLFADPFDMDRLPKPPLITHGKSAIGVRGPGGNQIKLSMEMYLDLIQRGNPDVVVVPGDPDTLLFETWGVRYEQKGSFGRGGGTSGGSGGVPKDDGTDGDVDKTINAKEAKKHTHTPMEGDGYPIAQSRNQLFKREERAFKWVQDFLDLFEKQEPSSSSSLSSPSGPLLFGTLGGLDHLGERTKFASRFHGLYHDSFDGYTMYLPSHHPQFEACIDASMKGFESQSTRAPSSDKKNASIIVSNNNNNKSPSSGREGKVFSLMGSADLFGVVKAIRAGIDLIDTCFLYQLTEQGKALVCSFGDPLDLSAFRNPKLGPSHGEDDDDTLSPYVNVLSPYYVVLDMNPSAPLKRNGPSTQQFSGPNLGSRILSKEDSTDPSSKTTTSSSINETNPLHQHTSTLSSPWRNDPSPLYNACPCWTCSGSTQHSRAYLHHLLTVQDMLARVLLMKHNLDQFSAFLKAVREALSRGDFDDRCELFLNSAKET